jgi:hypothetical protein
MLNTDLDNTMPIHPQKPDPAEDTLPVKTPISNSPPPPEIPVENPPEIEQTAVIKKAVDGFSDDTVAMKRKPPENAVSEPGLHENGAAFPGVQVEDGLISGHNKPEKPRKPRRWISILLGILVVLVLGASGGFIGYQVAIGMRLQHQTSQVTLTAAAQFQLAQADIAAGNYDVARQRLEYVIQLDPNFPGGFDTLTQVMLVMAETAVPTIAPTPTTIPLTATPDLRNEQQMFDAVQALLRAHDWNSAIGTVEILRKTNLAFRAVDVDGMYYTGLRHRGIEKIIGGNLEGGLYDLALAERIGPLDHDAESYRTWARYYLTGASFWRVDWAKVVQVFGEIYISLPNLSDDSGWTAQERYRVACINYADQLAQQEAWCDARFYYDQALALGSSGAVIPTATAVSLICEPPTPTPTMTVMATVTPTPTIIVTITTVDPLVGVCCVDNSDGLYNPTDPACVTFVCPSP